MRINFDKIEKLQVTCPEKWGGISCTPPKASFTATLFLMELLWGAVREDSLKFVSCWEASTSPPLLKKQRHLIMLAGLLMVEKMLYLSGLLFTLHI